MQHRLSIRSRDSWSLPVRDLFNFGIEAKKELSCINSRRERESGRREWFPNAKSRGKWRVGGGRENKGRNGRLTSFTEANSIGKIRRRLEEGGTFRGGGWPRETFIFQRSGRSSIYMIKFHLIRLPFSSKLYRLPESK